MSNMADMYAALKVMRSSEPAERFEIALNFLSQLLGGLRDVNPSNLNRCMKDLDRDWRSFVTRAPSFLYMGEMFTLDSMMFRQVFAQIACKEQEEKFHPLFEKQYTQLGWSWLSSCNPSIPEKEGTVCTIDLGG